MIRPDPYYDERRTNARAEGRERTASALLARRRRCGCGFPIHDLLAQSFTVFAPDNPGWGASETAEWMTEIQDYVLHHDSLIRELGLVILMLVGICSAG